MGQVAAICPDRLFLAMKSNIVFTQDLPGEREWLKRCFPGHEILETEFSGKWPIEPFTQTFSAIYEIPPDSVMDVSAINVPKYKSLYRLDENFISPKWCQADGLLINGLKFGSVPKASIAQVLHFPRSGTVFLESILYTKCGYTRNKGWNSASPTSDHYQLGGNDTLFYEMIENVLPDIFFCYRKNWWEWCVSNCISKKYGYFHHYDSVNWDSFSSFEIAQDHIEDLVRETTAVWNAMCHFRTRYPNLNFYIFEYSELIKHQQLTSHQKINYDKKQLISNYSSAKDFFESKYQSQFDRWASNSLSHLQTMNCKVLNDFDSLID